MTFCTNCQTSRSSFSQNLSFFLIGILPRNLMNVENKFQDFREILNTGMDITRHSQFTQLTCRHSVTICRQFPWKFVAFPCRFKHCLSFQICNRANFNSNHLLFTGLSYSDTSASMISTLTYSSSEVRAQNPRNRSTFHIYIHAGPLE